MGKPYIPLVSTQIIYCPERGHDIEWRKTLMLLIGDNSPAILQKVKGIPAMLHEHTTNKTAGSAGMDAGPVTNEFLTFRLGGEEYGIEILKVQEIRGYDAITHIANAPDFIKGVVNLRGIIVPIADMRIKFRLGKADYDQFTVVIILNVAGRVMGIVVDGVSDVITLGAEQMRPTPGMGSVIDTEYIMGLGTVDERMLILIDIEKLMMSNHMGLIEHSIN